ncbi:MAG: hypothetical protein HFH50_10375 [Lachnospiraceae bacterium]|jgi:hypothetical protein|nr:hypothetical protein [Lachnospiraceae bacterium]
MKLKALDILNVYESLEKLSEHELSLETSFVIAKNIKELLLSKEIIETKRNNIITKYAEKDKNGAIAQEDDGGIKINDPVKFSNELNELLSSEININLTKIYKKDLEKITIQPKELLPLIGTLLEE